MSRASKAAAARQHEELIGAASRLFRERGAGSVSVPDVMAELGDQAVPGDLDPAAQQEQVLADLATTVGAVLLARATAGDRVSDEVLAAARRRLG
jgi:hypothetical protein